MNASLSRLEIRLTPELLDKIRTAAQKRSISASDYVRQAVHAALAEELAEEFRDRMLEAAAEDKALETETGTNHKCAPANVYLARCTDTESFDAPDEDEPSNLEISFELIAKLHPVDHQEPIPFAPSLPHDKMTLQLDERNDFDVYRLMGQFSHGGLCSSFQKDIINALFLVEWTEDGWQLVSRYEKRVRWLTVMRARELASATDDPDVVEETE
jgi:Arc/MetJ-type ribon-helix-helix transcriptional regulator